MPSSGDFGAAAVLGVGDGCVGRGVGLGLDVVGVRAGCDRRGGLVVGDAVELEHPPDLAHRAELGVVDLDDAAVGDEQLVEQRLFGRADGLHRRADLGRDRDPLVGRELREALRHDRVVVVEEHHLLGREADAHRRVAR